MSNCFICNALSTFRIYRMFAQYTYKHGHTAAAFFFFLCGLFSMFPYRVISFFEDMAVLFLDPVTFDEIGRDIFGDE